MRQCVVIIMSHLIIKASSYGFQNEELAVCGFLCVLPSSSDPGGYERHEQARIVFDIVSALDKPNYDTRYVSNC